MRYHGVCMHACEVILFLVQLNKIMLSKSKWGLAYSPVKVYTYVYAQQV